MAPASSFVLREAMAISLALQEGGTISPSASRLSLDHTICSCALCPPFSTGALQCPQGSTQATPQTSKIPVFEPIGCKNSQKSDFLIFPVSAFGELIPCVILCGFFSLSLSHLYI